MSAACVRAQMLSKQGNTEAVNLADAFCLEARERIAQSFQQLFGPNDDALYKVARQVLDGRHTWLEQGIIGMVPDEGRDDPAVTSQDPKAKTARREAAGVG